jgi:hypothetical protein
MLPEVVDNATSVVVVVLIANSDHIRGHHLSSFFNYFDLTRLDYSYYYSYFFYEYYLLNLLN